jgi:hypothetical protein
VAAVGGTGILSLLVARLSVNLAPGSTFQRQGLTHPSSRRRTMLAERSGIGA